MVGVEEAELPQFTIEGYETNERKIKLATGEPKFILKIYKPKGYYSIWSCNSIFSNVDSFFRNLSAIVIVI